MINKALEYAYMKHEGQTRKGSTTPYILHCIEAGLIATQLSTNSQDGTVNENLVAAAILHDTIEDAGVTYEELKEEFNQEIADLVKLQSEDKSKTWQERKSHTIDFLKENKSLVVEQAILADKLSNVRSILKDHREIGEELWSRFNSSKEKQFWYYSSIGENLSQLKGHPLHEEYKKAIFAAFFC